LAVFAGDDVAVHRLPADGQVTIGRAEGNDIRIENSAVSRNHAVLHLGPPMSVEDLGGANGTFLHDLGASAGSGETFDLKRLSKAKAVIELGQSINLGTTTIVVRRCALGDGDVSHTHALGSEGGIILSDAGMKAVYDEARRAARGTISVLILGETGVGKEILAQEIHRCSPRASGPFVGINCSALSESLLESELFGHEKGAFTGAVTMRAGLFETAEGGSVFLDEVGELSPSTQVKLLRVLEERKVLRVGGRVPRAIDVRFISATHRDLEAAIDAGKFREDLYFRLNGIELTVPPLRCRSGEIESLAQFFAADSSAKLNRSTAPAISAAFLGYLHKYAWPGNVRELRNVMDRAVVLSAGETLRAEHLPAKLVTAASSPTGSREANKAQEPIGVNNDLSRLRREMSDLELKRIKDALERCGGNQTQAAELLGISRRTLVTRLGEYPIARPRKRS
jgi:DNA-binding NtrC family response regulator